MQRTSSVVREKTATPQVGEPLRLRLLGDFAITFEGRPVAVTKRKTKALLAYLALSDTGRDTRERLVGLLWSENDEEHARASLRQAVHEIKSACDAAGFDGLDFDKLTLGLQSGRFRSDVDDILAAIVRRGVSPRLLSTQRLADTLLDGLDDLDPAFQIWVRTRRQLLHDRLVSSLEAFLSVENGAQDASQAASALLNLDATHEPACRHLIQTRAAKGDLSGAMKAYKALWDVLEDDFDIEPSKETQDLIVGIKQQADWSESLGSAPTALPPAAPAIRRSPVWAKGLLISVGAFDAGGVPPERRYVVDGFQHELVACLMRFREWSVRTLRPQERPQPVSWSSPPEYLIEGTTYESTGTIRLVITFRDVATGICVWSDRFALTLATWLDMQQHIVRGVASAMNVHLSAERLRRMATDGVVDLDIHDRWLRGQALVHHLASAHWQSALTIFEDLVREQPDYGPALTSLVQMNNTEHIARPGRFRDRSKAAQILAMAQRAASLDPLDSRAQLNLAWTHQLAGHLDEATLHASLATELNGSDPWTLMSAGHIFAYCGDYARAAALSQASIDLTPMATPQQMTYRSIIDFLAKDYPGCLHAAAHGLESSPGFSLWICAALAHMGRVEDARIELQKAFDAIAADWHGDRPATRENIAHWMLHLYPIGVPADWERLRAGLALAGAPVAQVAFGTW